MANYIDDLTGRLAITLNDCDDDLLRLYALLALVRGKAVTNQDVHDAWSVWTAARRPDHQSLVPFHQLAAEVQELDSKYRDAIRAVSP